MVSVPSNYTISQNRALYDACKIAQFPLAKAIPNHVAVGYSYMWTKKQELRSVQGEVNVLFVDFGHSGASLYVISFFNKTQARIRYLDTINLGVRDLDQILLPYIAQEFQKQNGQALQVNNM